MTAATEQFYSRLQHAFDHFNITLFDNSLPDVLITIIRKPGMMGYLSHARWVNGVGDMRDELALNPEYFANRPLIELFQTIVHEQCHLWQFHFGKPSRASYHNKEWADKMISVGLIPSDTGQPGGRQTGQKMSDYPLTNGKLVQSAGALVKKNGFVLPWVDRHVAPAQTQPISQDPQIDPDIDDGGLLESIIEALRTPLVQLAPELIQIRTPAQRQASKLKYSCVGCGNNVWGKPGLNLICGDCQTSFI